ncbi:DUF2244 domain-containing protein [Roseibium litorale]|nr:DUF2244 domain-containing protein [Roseibium litorale]
MRNVEDRHEEEDRPLFEAVLTPYRSLSPRGFMIFMVCVAAVSFASGALFLSIGAWPVFGFFGLDVVLIWAAFRMNYASARRYEEISLSAHELIIRKVGPGRKSLEYRFNPFWVRLLVQRLDDEGVVKISLRSRGETVSLGDFLNPEDRTSFAGAMVNALAAAKAGRS